MSTAFTIGTFMVGVVGATVTVTILYYDIMQRFRDDERSAYWAHKELMGEVCTINQKLTKGYQCPAIPPYKDDRVEAPDEASPG